MLESGARVIAENVRIVAGFHHDEPIYSLGTITGRVCQRSASRFVEWAPNGTCVFEPAERPPTKDQLGCYWVETDNKARYLCHESEIKRYHAPVFARLTLR